MTIDMSNNLNNLRLRHNVNVMHITSDLNITTIDQAVNYLIQKCKTAKKHKIGDKWVGGSLTVVGGTVITAGAAALGATGNPILGATTAAVGYAATGLASTWGWRMLRMATKSVWKRAHGTRGKHRKEAAHTILVCAATPAPANDYRRNLAIDILALFYGGNFAAQQVINNCRQPPPGAIRKMRDPIAQGVIQELADMFKSNQSIE